MRTFRGYKQDAVILAKHSEIASRYSSTKGIESHDAVVDIPVCTIQFQGRVILILRLVTVPCTSMHVLKCFLKHVTDVSIGES